MTPEEKSGHMDEHTKLSAQGAVSCQSKTEADTVSKAMQSNSD